MKRRRRWSAFLAERRVLFGSWGDYDRNQLAQDARNIARLLPWITGKQR